jgi:predicted flap endonuclease-1-like 5' DNA nuclease
MNKSGFIQRMKKDKKSDSTIKRNIELTEIFKRYLLEDKKRKLEEALPKDLEDFYIWAEENKLRNIRMYFMSLCAYYEFLHQEKIVFKAKEIMGNIELSTYRLKDFQGVSRKNIKKLEKNGVKTAKQILEIGHTKKGRDKLSKETDIPVVSILELVKLSDLARIPGVKRIRARLYYEAGLDTLQKMAAFDSEELRKISADYIKKTGFKGIPPTPKEAEHTVSMAKYLNLNSHR